MLKRFFILILSSSLIICNYGILSAQDDEATEQVDSSDSEEEEDADKEDDLDVDSLDEEEEHHEESKSHEKAHEESVETETEIHAETEKTQEETESLQSSSVQVEDTQISRTIQDHLKTSFKNYNFNYTIKDGIVTLKGVVNSTQDKDAIEKDFKSIPGVKKVNNSLQVR